MSCCPLWTSTEQFPWSWIAQIQDLASQMAPVPRSMLFCFSSQTSVPGFSATGPKEKRESCMWVYIKMVGAFEMCGFTIWNTIWLPKQETKITEPTSCLHIWSFQTAVSVENPLNLRISDGCGLRLLRHTQLAGRPASPMGARFAEHGWVSSLTWYYPYLSIYNMIHVSVSPTHPCLAEARDLDSCRQVQLQFSVAKQNSPSKRHF